MRTDTIFYQLFQVMPNLLAELLGETEGDYEFKSVEIKELARRIDGVFLPKGDQPQPIYFAEVQFQTDERLYERLITETFVYLGQYRPTQTWFCVALWASRKIAVSIPLYYEGLVAAGLLRVVYLDELEVDSLGVSIVRLVTTPDQGVDAVLQTLVGQVKGLEDDQFRAQIIELVERMLVYRFPNFSTEVLQTMFTEVDLKKTRFYREVFQEGLQEGRQEGLQEGQKTTIRQMVARLRQRNFSPQGAADLLGLTIAEVNQYWQE
ncbi:MAG: hypothetical protein RLZZ490_500 [Cyanobacteriota bacterium]